MIPLTVEDLYNMISLELIPRDTMKYHKTEPNLLSNL